MNDERKEVPFHERFIALYLIVLVATFVFVVGLIIITGLLGTDIISVGITIFLIGITPWLVLSVLGFFLFLYVAGVGSAIRSLIRVVQGKERMP